MKNILIILCIVSGLTTYGQPQIVQVNNPQVRSSIEEYSQQNTFPDVIKFVQDGGNGGTAWVTSVENFTNGKFSSTRINLKSFFESRGISNNANAVKDILETHGSVRTHMPVQGLDPKAEKQNER